MWAHTSGSERISWEKVVLIRTSTEGTKFRGSRKKGIEGDGSGYLKVDGNNLHVVGEKRIWVDVDTGIVER